MFVYGLSGCGCESRCSHLEFRYRACFEQGVPWHSIECRFTLKRVHDMMITYSLIIRVTSYITRLLWEFCTILTHCHNYLCIRNVTALCIIIMHHQWKSTYLHHFNALLLLKWSISNIFLKKWWWRVVTRL